MEQTRKNFKITSIIILALAGATLLNLVAGLAFGDFSTEGVSSDELLFAKIFILVVSFIMLLPQIYIGIKGLLVAKKPGTSKGHIIWAIILFIFSVINLINSGIGIITKDGMESVTGILSILVEASVYFEYIKFGRAILKETE